VAPGGTRRPDWWASLVASHRRTLEIGANIGLYTVVGARAAGGTPYRAVEPNPASYDVLRRNLALNGLSHVAVLEAAVVGAGGPGMVELRFPDRDAYAASAGAFVEGAIDLEAPAGRHITVPAVAMPALVGGVDLVKLDIEGLELDVLASVRDWIVDTAPTIVVEVRDDAVHLQRFLADLIAAAGYECHAMIAGSVRLVPAAAVAGGSLQRDLGIRDVTLGRGDRLAAALAVAASRRAG
jgi:FkbM family methyltransferase